MAQLRASSALDIYNTLTNDSTFMSYVGTYTFADNSTLPSIVITTPGADTPGVKSQQGLEVIIHDTGNMTSRTYISGASDPVFTWPMFLIIWDPDVGTSMTEALQRIVYLFPFAKTIDTVSTGVVLGAKAQTQVLITSDCPVNTM